MDYVLSFYSEADDEQLKQFVTTHRSIKNNYPKGLCVWLLNMINRSNNYVTVKAMANLFGKANVTWLKQCSYK